MPASPDAVTVLSPRPLPPQPRRRRRPPMWAVAVVSSSVTATVCLVLAAVLWLAFAPAGPAPRVVADAPVLPASR